MLKQDKALFILSLFVISSLFLSIQSVAARGGTPPPSDDQVNAIAKQMYCPVCENIPLDVCDTQACAQWRDLIREKLAQGWTEAQIKSYFVEQYGDRVLAVPPLAGGSGLNILIYVVPLFVLLAGIIFLFRIILVGKAERQEKPSGRQYTITPQQEQYLSDLEEELERKKAKDEE